MTQLKGTYSRNSKIQFHGYQEWYWFTNNTLQLRGMYHNGNKVGYLENHDNKQTIYYI